MKRKIKMRQTREQGNAGVEPRIDLLSRIRALLLWRRLSLGVSCSSAGIRHALLAFCKNGAPVLISAGCGVPWYVRLLSPLAAHMDLGNAVVSLKKFDIGGSDPDSWIDQNEDDIVPKGFKADQIVNQYIARDSILLSATITRKALDQELNALDSIKPLSASIPLWNLNSLLARKMERSLILWRLTNEGSMFGLIDNGTLCKLCNFWVGAQDLAENPEHVANEIGALLGSIAAGTSANTVALYCPDSKFTVPEKLSIPGFEIKMAAPPKGVAIADLDAYANALHESTPLDFAPFDIAHKSRAAVEQHRIMWSSIRWFGGAVAALAVVLMAVLGVQTAIRHTGSEALGLVNEQLESYTRAMSSRDSLMAVLRGQAIFLSDQSTVTSLLDRLQEGFPEGTWAEEISITEINKQQYRTDIRALAYSSSLIGSMITRLERIPGISGVRMVYSEQTSVDKGKKAIQVKVEGVWGP